MKLFVALVVLCLEAIVSSNSFRQEKQAEENNCDRPECFTYASSLMAGIDWTADPCNDFFQFACGRWIEKESFPERIIVIDDLRIAQNKYNSRVKDILYAPVYPNETALLKAKHMFAACLNADQFITANLKEISDNINILGRWKLGSSEIIERKNFMEMMTNVFMYTDVSVPFGLVTASSDTNRSIYHVALVQPGVKSLLTTLYPLLTAKDLVTIGSVLFDVKDAVKAYKDAQNILKFDDILKKMIDPDISEAYGSIQQFEVTFPGVDWMTIFSTIFSGIKNFTRNEQIGRLHGFNFFLKFIPLIKDSNIAKVAYDYVIAYETIQLLRWVGDSLPSPLREISSLRPYTANSKWDYCTEFVRNCFDMPIALKYGQLYDNIEEEIKSIKEMMHDIIEEFGKRLNQSDWLDEPSRDSTLRKLNEVKNYYEYPEWGTDLNTVNEFYKRVENTGTLVGDQFQCIALNRRRNFQELNKTPSEHFKWQWSPTMVNAYYSPTENKIRILQAILEKPVFNRHRLRVMNYAGLGYILGHELTHGFDNIGVQFDGKGNLNPWLSPESQEKFNSRAQCLIDQYSNYELTSQDLPGPLREFTVDGTLTLRENIADAGGLMLSYNAYKHWSETNPPETMPEIMTQHFNNEQIFFLSFARTWCVKYQYGVSFRHLQDTHSPDKLRINGPLANFEKFGETFGCDSSSPMVRGERACHVW